MRAIAGNAGSLGEAHRDHHLKQEETPMQRQKHDSALEKPRHGGSDDPAAPEAAAPTHSELDRLFATADSAFDQIHASDSETFLRQSTQTGGQ